MTKAELIAALAAYPDDAKVFVVAQDYINNGLATPQLSFYGLDGPDTYPFIVLEEQGTQEVDAETTRAGLS